MQGSDKERLAMDCGCSRFRQTPYSHGLQYAAPGIHSTSVCFCNWKNMNSTMETSCAFCGVDQIRVLEENESAFATRDGFPVVPLHSLVVPKRHVPDYFSITEAEQLACLELLHALRKRILSEDSTVAGFNVGIKPTKYLRGISCGG